MNRTVLVPMVRGHLDQRRAKIPADLVFDFEHLNRGGAVRAIPFDYYNRVGENLPEFMKRSTRKDGVGSIDRYPKDNKTLHVRDTNMTAAILQVHEETRKFKFLVAHKNFITLVPYPYVRTLDLVRFAPYLRDAAMRVVKNVSENYDAFQVRWGDMLLVRGFKRTLKPFILAAKKLRFFERVANETANVERGIVYLATEEANRTHFDEMTKTFDVRFASDFEPHFEPLKAVARVIHPDIYPTLLAAVESLVCICSKRYVGTQSSSYSSFPKEVRALETGFSTEDHFPGCVGRRKDSVLVHSYRR